MDMSAIRHSGKGGIITCMAPDVCKTPVGSSIVPIPYMIISQIAWAQKTAKSVKLTDLEAFTMKSRTDKVVGDEPGTAGGVKSSVNRGWCKPISNHGTVLVEGAELIQSNNLYDMNCAGPNGAGNTVGRIMYFD
jgi:hypothetical protein